jgi:hypothetical protein
MTGEEDNFHNNFHHKHEHGFLNAIVLFTVGFLLLLNNFGFISWDIWFVLWKFWPLLLIFAGLRRISANSPSLRLLFGLISVGLLFLALIYSMAITNSNFNDWLQKNYPSWSKVFESVPQEEPSGGIV